MERALHVTRLRLSTARVELLSDVGGQSSFRHLSLVLPYLYHHLYTRQLQEVGNEPSSTGTDLLLHS